MPHPLHTDVSQQIVLGSSMDGAIATGATAAAAAAADGFT